MSELRVDNIVDMGGSGAPQLRKGANVTGISTITQAVVGNATINAGGINATGIVTSSSNKFVGDFASGNITAGVMTATSSVVASNITINSGGVNASGIVSATSYTGSGANLTGVGLSIAPLSYNPDVSDSSVDLTAGIGLTFNQRVFAGVGTVTLSLVSVGSTVVEVLGIGTAVTKTYTVTVASSKFYLDGNQTYSPTLYPGGIYTFDQSAATNGTHPLRFATAADAAGSTEYTTGVETNGTPGSSGAYTRITVAADAPDTLYYYCTNHSGMGSNVSIGANVQFNNDADPPNITINPRNDLSRDTVYAISYPSGAFTQSGAGGSFVGTAYTFVTRNLVDQMWMVGANTKGQLGQNSSGNYFSSPVQVPGQWSKFSMGGFHTLATKTDGTLWSWGDNGSGRLGQNNTTHRSSPVQVGSDTTWNGTLSAAYTTSFAIKSDGTLWSWGSNDHGQHGTNTQGVQISSPVQVPGTTWSSLTAKTTSACFAVKTDGTLWSWGYNGQGALGQNNRSKYSSPAQIPGTTWTSKMSSGHSHFHCIKTDGTLWAIGEADHGQIGDNTNASKSSPVQIPGTNWSDIGGGMQATYAKKTDGTFWSWGYNANAGDLGLNDRIKRSSPVQIPGTTWKAGKGGGRDIVAVVKTDGTLWAWGSNTYGTLAQNNRTQYSSPVQIPGTTWSKAYGNYTGGNGMTFILTKEV